MVARVVAYAMVGRLSRGRLSLREFVYQAIFITVASEYALV